MPLKQTVLIFLASLLATTSNTALSECEPSSVRTHSFQPGKRTYKADGYTVYEGSLYRNLFDISRLEGLKGIIPNLANDIHLPKRLHARGSSLEDALRLINDNIVGVNVFIKDDLIVVGYVDGKTAKTLAQKLSKQTLTSTEKSCGAKTFYVFQVRNSTLEDNISSFEEQSGWVFEWEEGSSQYKKAILEPRAITGTSYYEILAKLLVDTGLGAVYE